MMKVENNQLLPPSIDLTRMHLAEWLEHWTGLSIKRSLFVSYS